MAIKQGDKKQYLKEAKELYKSIIYPKLKSKLLIKLFIIILLTIHYLF